MTALITGILSAIGDLINPSSGENTVAYVVLLAMPVLAGVVLFARRLVKKAKN